MSNNVNVPRPRDIVSTCQSIRAHWTSAKLRARRQLAEKKLRQLVRRLAHGQSA
jgi:hypothetical protein